MYYVINMVTNETVFVSRSLEYAEVIQDLAEKEFLGYEYVIYEKELKEKLDSYEPSIWKEKK
tara:strand:+ start:157 stop:342 length:186 start_codon:yes stop_codon:yes gene_type:complete